MGNSLGWENRNWSATAHPDYQKSNIASQEGILCYGDGLPERDASGVRRTTMLVFNRSPVTYRLPAGLPFGIVRFTKGVRSECRSASGYKDDKGLHQMHRTNLSTWYKADGTTSWLTSGAEARSRTREFNNERKAERKERAANLLRSRHLGSVSLPSVSTPARTPPAWVLDRIARSATPHGCMARTQEWWRDVWFDNSSAGEVDRPSHAYLCHNGDLVPTEGCWWLREGAEAAARTNTWLSPLHVPPTATQLLAILGGDGYESELDETYKNATPEVARTALAAEVAAAPASPTLVHTDLDPSEGRAVWIRGVFTIQEDTGQIAQVPHEPEAPADQLVSPTDTTAEPGDADPSAASVEGFPSGAVTFSPGYQADGHVWPLMTASYTEGNLRTRKREIYVRTEHALARTPSGLWRHCYQCTTCRDAPLFSSRDHLRAHFTAQHGATPGDLPRRDIPVAPKSDDIRLQPECLATLEAMGRFSKADYQEAFTNNGNYATDTWQGKQIILNPPWHLKNNMAAKLRRDHPSKFVAIVNLSATGPMTTLMQAAGLEPMKLTVTTAGGFFVRHSPGGKVERLHHPAHWIPVAYVGTAADLARAATALDAADAAAHQASTAEHAAASTESDPAESDGSASASDVFLPSYSNTGGKLRRRRRRTK